jgi:hypothetical protein
MGRNDSDVRERRAAEGPEMLAAMRRGVTEALREHKRRGHSIIVWDRETKQIVEVPAGEIRVPDEAIEDETGPSSID